MHPSPRTLAEEMKSKFSERLHLPPFLLSPALYIPTGMKRERERERERVSAV
jgi:hypothetical protein